MPNVILNRNTISAIIKRKLKDVELYQAVSGLGPSIDSMTDDEISIDVPPNRPDLLCEQGVGRALLSFLNIKPGLRKYPVKKSGQRVIVDESVASVRPYTACAIVKGIKCTDETIKEIIQIQEKLHITYGRQRRKCAIGIYPLEHIRTPIKFVAKKPEEIVFAPLDMSKELTATQILVLHPTGREFAHLLQNEKKYPVFIDSRNNILSMPPIINSNTVGKITEKTRDVFVEVSGFDFEYLNTALCMLVCSLADMGGEIYSMEVQMKGKKRVTPEFAPRTMKLDLEFINKRLGTTLSEADMKRALAKMGHDFANKTAFSPRWRSDLLHPVDYAEEIAIALGYDSITPVAHAAGTIGKAQPKEVLAEYLRDILVGQGFLEIKNTSLISEAAQTRKINTSKPLVKLANAFNEEYSTLRRTMLPSMLLTLQENKNSEFPHLAFEIGTVFTHDATKETGVLEEEHLAIAISDPSAGFVRIKQVISSIADAFGVSLECADGDNTAMIEGRVASISLNSAPSGTMGEIHPSVLEQFSIEMPVAYAELRIGSLLHALHYPPQDLTHIGAKERQAKQ